MMLLDFFRDYLLRKLDLESRRLDLEKEKENNRSKEKNRELDILEMNNRFQYSPQDLNNFKEAHTYIKGDVMVFISHDSKYNKQKELLANMLGRYFRIWPDKPDGSSQNDLLDDGIRNCKVIIIFVFNPRTFIRTDGGFYQEMIHIEDYLRRAENHEDGKKLIYVCYNCGEDDASISSYLKSKCKDETHIDRILYIIRKKNMAFYNFTDNPKRVGNTIIEQIRNAYFL